MVRCGVETRMNTVAKHLWVIRTVVHLGERELLVADHAGQEIGEAPKFPKKFS